MWYILQADEENSAKIPCILGTTQQQDYCRVLFPSAKKNATVMMMPIKGKNLIFHHNYRIISLHCSMAKLMEGIILTTSQESCVFRISHPKLRGAASSQTQSNRRVFLNSTRHRLLRNYSGHFQSCR